MSVVGSFRLQDIADEKLRDFFREVIQDSRQQTITDHLELNVDDVFSALDQYKGPPNQRANGIINWNDYQSIITANDNRIGINISYPYFGHAVRFLESYRLPLSPISKDYSCDFSKSDWLRQPHIYPDKAIIVATNSTDSENSPRFEVKFETKPNTTVYDYSLFNIRSSIDIYLNQDGPVRIEVFNNKLDRMKDLPAHSVDISLDEIRQRDSNAAAFLTETSAANLNDNRESEVSDELLGYLYSFVKEAYRTESEYKPFRWLYHLFAIPSDIKYDQLPEEIIGRYSDNPLKAIGALRKLVLRNVSTFLKSDYFEDEIEIIFQSSLHSQFDETTIHNQFLTVFTKLDVLVYIQNNQKPLCAFYQLPRALKQILFSYMFDNSLKNESSVIAYRKAIIGRMKTAFDFAEEILPQINEHSEPKDLLIKIWGKVRKWFPEINPSEKSLNHLWSLVEGPYKDGKQKESAFACGINFLFSSLYNSICAKRALSIINNLVLQKSSTKTHGEQMKMFADFIAKLDEGAFLTAVTVKSSDTAKYCGDVVNGCWTVIRKRKPKNLPNSLLASSKFYLSDNLGIKDGLKVSLHELLHAAENYGHILNGLKYNDYKVEGRIKRGKYPNWLSEALAEYMALREMRRRGFQVTGNHCGCKYDAISLRALIRKYGKPLEDALIVAHATGDFTSVKNILNQGNQKLFSDFMYDYNSGVSFLWVHSLGINVQFDD